MKTLARFVFASFICFILLVFVAPLRLQAISGKTALPSASGKPAQSSPGNIPSISFNHLTTSDGLSEASVAAIVQDKMGFLWFATQLGLNKYDGYRFAVYTHDSDDPNSLSANNLRALYLAQDQTLWIGTFDGGLNRLDTTTNKFTHFQHNPNDPQSLSDNYVRAIQEDSDGDLWVGTQNGLNRLDPKTETFTHYQHKLDDPKSLAHDRIYSLTVDHNHTIWVATASGLCRYERLTDNFQCYQNNPDDPHSLSNNLVFVVYTDSTGTLWVATANGLNALDMQHGTITRYLNDPNDPQSLGSNEVHAIEEDHDGKLWIGTFGGGLSLFDRSSKTFTVFRHEADNPDSLSIDNILSIHEDRSGILWVGTWTADLSYIDTARHKFSSSFTVPTSFITAIQEDDNYRWVGTFGDGLYQIDRKSLSVTHFHNDPATAESLRSDNIYALQLDQQGVLWVGTGQGLDRFDVATQTFTHPYAEATAAAGLDDVQIQSIFRDSRGWLWMGTQVGLYCLDLSTGTFSCYQRESEAANRITAGIVLAIRESDDKTLWIGSDSGLYHIDTATGLTEHYTHDATGSNSLSEKFLTTIQRDTDGSLWLGTWGGGLNHFDPTTGTFNHYNKKNGLADDLVLGILQDSQRRLWISTSNGLSLFDPKTETFRTYDHLDGLPLNAFTQGAYYQNEHGEMFFGVDKNVVNFFPDDIHDNTYIPPVVLTGFQLFNKPVTIGEHSLLKQHPNYTSDLSLTYDQSVFSFEYAALNFSAPDKNQYAYKMEGFEPDWNYVGNRRLATYTNLNPGSYTFRVIASNNDGVWNNDGLTVHLTITPPWWQTWWAYLLYVVSGIAVVAGYIRFRTRAQERELKIQRRELAHERQLRESMERADRSKDDERARIAREMHDGLAQTLAGLRFRVRTWTTMLTSDPNKLSTELSDVGPILDETVQELRRVIFALRPILLDEMGLVPSITQLVDSISKHYPIKIHTCIVGDEALLSAALEHNAFRIVQESLHNAIRHARANNIWLNVTIGKEHLLLEIRDDGVGFDLALIEERAKQGHFGLINVRHRAETLKGTATIESTIGQGTTIRATLPVKNDDKTTD